MSKPSLATPLWFLLAAAIAYLFVPHVETNWTTQADRDFSRIMLVVTAILTITGFLLMIRWFWRR